MCPRLPSLGPPSTEPGDWRLRVDLHVEGFAHELLEHLEAVELEHDLSTSFEDRVVVSRDGSVVFCYAATKSQAQAAERVISSLAAQHGWSIDTELHRWHPSAEDWEDPDTPVPENDAERASEHARVISREREESEEAGYPEFEVRAECPSHREAVEFAQRLAREGVPNVRRSHYVLVGAADEDNAAALAARLREVAPPGTRLTVEATAQAARAGMPPNPFVIFGGLGV